MAIRPPALALARPRPGSFFIGLCLARPNISPGRAVPSPAQYPTEPCRASPRALLAAQVRARRPISCRAAPAEPGTTTEFGPPEAHPRRGGGGDGRRCGDEEAAGVGVAETRRWRRLAGRRRGGGACRDLVDAPVAGILWRRRLRLPVPPAADAALAARPPCSRRARLPCSPTPHPTPPHPPMPQPPPRAPPAAVPTSRARCKEPRRGGGGVG